MNPIPWIPILCNFQRHPTDTMYYIVCDSVYHLKPCAIGLSLIFMYSDCKYLVQFPKALPTELKGIAV